MELLLRRPWIALVAALVVETVIFFVTQTDFLAADPLWYADIAHRLSVDPAAVFAQHEIHPFVMRIGLTMPLALFYRVFGVSTLVSNLPCLLAADGILVVVYSAVSTPRAKLIGLLLAVACVAMFHQMLMLNVDLPSAALMGASIVYLARRDRPRGAWWLTAAVVAWFAAFLVKETALWCAPVWIYAIVCDLHGAGWRRTVRTFAPAIAAGVVFAAGYLVLCAELWGDPFARFKGIEHAVADVRGSPTYRDAWAMAGTPTSAWIARLTWQVPRLLYQMFGATLVPVVLAPWLVRGRDRIWWWATATIVLFYWFGSSTLSEYMPLPISQRMLIPVLPFILVTATLAADAGLDRWRMTGARLALVIVLAGAILVPAVLSIRATIGHGRPETEAFAALRRDVAADPARHVVLVCGEPRCVSIAGFYFAFEPPPNLNVTYAGDFARAPRPDHVTVRALVNLIRSAGVRRADPHADLTAPIDQLELPRIVWHKDVHLYDAGDGTKLWDALQPRD